MTSQAPEVPDCPECWSGEHRLCHDQTWDDQAGDFAPCPCKKAGHGAELQHHLPCPSPDVWIQNGLDTALITCRACHAETRIPRTWP